MKRSILRFVWISEWGEGEEIIGHRDRDILMAAFGEATYVIVILEHRPVAGDVAYCCVWARAHISTDISTN